MYASVVQAQCPNGACGPELIPNGDFSATTAECADPDYSNILYFNASPLQDWWGVYDYSTPGFHGTPDYYNTAGCTDCGVLTGSCGNNNPNNACPANSGSIHCFSSNFEYIQAQLNQQLVMGQEYCLSFDNSFVFGNAIGAVFFSPSKVSHSGQQLIPLTPTISFSIPFGLGCTTSSFTFCADGTEQWIIFGPGAQSNDFIIDNISLVEHCNTGMTVSVSATVNPIGCGGSTDITATATGPASVGATYVWSPNIGAGPGPHTVSPGSTTTYYVTVSGNGSCGPIVITDSITIVVSGGLTNTEASTDEICAGDDDGTITLVATSGTAPFTYDIGFGPTNTTGIFINLPPNTYNYTITDDNGCTTTGTITILPGPSCCPMTNTVSSTQPECAGVCDGTITLTQVGGIPPVQFSIDNGMNNQLSGNFSSLCAGTYNILIEDDIGCQFTNTVTLTDPPALTLSASSTDVLCFGDCTGTLSALGGGGTGSLTYLWDGGPTPGSQNQINVCPGTYIVTLSDSNNCTTTANTTVLEPAVITITTNSISDENCGACDGSADFVAGGGSPGFTYDIGNGPQAGGMFLNLCQGNYTLTVIDNNNCSNTLPFIVNSIGGPTATLQAQTDATCNGDCDGTATVSASGGAMPYTYDIGAGPSPSPILTGLCAGTYTITIADASGCETSLPVTINEPPEVTGSVTAQTDETCTGDCDGTVTVSASVGMSPFTFDIGNGPQSTGTFTALCSGAYTVTIIDADGCEGTVAINIQPGLPIADATITSSGIFCENDPPTDLVANDPGGTWSGIGITDATNGTFDPSVSGTGTFTITYLIAGPCGDSDDLVVSVNALPTVIAPADMQVCHGELVTLSGQGTAVSYSWDNGINDGVPFTATGTTIYTVTGTDANGCAATDQVEVTVDPELVIDFDIAPVTCPGEADGSITATVSGGTPPYSIQWDNGETSLVLDPIDIGTYQITVVDDNGCTQSAEAFMFSDDSGCEYLIWVANIFSPNGDGTNDVLHVMGANIVNLNFQIYNRWGNKVFESNDQSEGWDGTFAGSELNTGVFAYFVSATFINGSVQTLQGNVMLTK